LGDGAAIVSKKRSNWAIIACPTEAGIGLHGHEAGKRMGKIPHRRQQGDEEPNDRQHPVRSNAVLARFRNAEQRRSRKALPPSPARALLLPVPPEPPWEWAEASTVPVLLVAFV
jgi:hypothetical protein